MEKLLQEEIDRRMIQWRNDRLLEPQRKQRMEELEQRCAYLEAESARKDLIIEKLLLRVEQLEAMVFGRKKKSDDHDDLPPPSFGSGTPEKQPRSPASFRRSTPKPDDVTNRTHHPLRSCPDCGSALRQRRTVTRFVEDIPLPQKIVTEQTIESGFCPCCKKTRSAIPLSPQHSTLGQNVRLYVLFAVTVLGLTFEKIKAHLYGLHRLSVSDGELAAIIREGHRRLLPAMENIASKIREAPAAHYDETSYPVQHGEQGNYAWVKTSSIGPETIFCLGQTRGKGNAERLRGPPSDQVGVSDDYGAYDNLFENHALCWAHPLRKFRDLAGSGALSKKHHVQCRRFYEKFHALERSTALTIAAPLSQKQRHHAAEKIGKKIDALMTTDACDPPSLATLKRTFLHNREQYLVCIRLPDVPMTNNKAERSLRHLVIKRLVSFGSRTQQGAQAMETILSVCLTLWRKKPKDYFGELRSLMAA
jgi:transposase